MRDEAEATGIRAQTILREVQRVRDRLLDRAQVAARAFLDDEGKLRPGVAEWLAELAADNFVNGRGFDRDALVMAQNTGRRDLVLEIMASMQVDVARLDELNRLEREARP